MKLKFLKTYNKLIAMMLSLLGIGGTISFTGCDGNTPGAEYGTPHATFKVHGKVTSDGNISIPNIKVKMQFDSTYTDQNGEYRLEVVDFPTGRDFTVRFEDIDGSENGSYLLKDSIVEFNDPKFVNGSGGWNQGEVSKEFNVELEEDK